MTYTFLNENGVTLVKMCAAFIEIISFVLGFEKWIDQVNPENSFYLLIGCVSEISIVCVCVRGEIEKSFSRC